MHVPLLAASLCHKKEPRYLTPSGRATNIMQPFKSPQNCPMIMHCIPIGCMKLLLTMMRLHQLLEICLPLLDLSLPDRCCRLSCLLLLLLLRNLLLLLQLFFLMVKLGPLPRCHC